MDGGLVALSALEVSLMGEVKKTNNKTLKEMKRLLEQASSRQQERSKPMNDSKSRVIITLTLTLIGPRRTV